MPTGPYLPRPSEPPPLPNSAADSETEVVELNRDVTMSIVILNVAVFLAERLLNPRAHAFFEHRYALSLEGLKAGAWWQFLSYQFLHGGWFHLGFNLLFLHSLGPVMETTLGWRRFLTLYLASGAMGGLVQMAGAALSPANFAHPVVGASAGLCGLLAALGAIYAETRLPVLLFFVFPITLKAKLLLLGFAVVTVAGTLVPIGHVAHLAHLGGLLGGLCVVNLMTVNPIELVASGDSLPSK